MIVMVAITGLMAACTTGFITYGIGKRIGINAAIKTCYKNGAHGQARKIRKELL